MANPNPVQTEAFHRQKFKPGKSGNPEGQRGYAISSALKRIGQAQELKYSIEIVDSAGKKRVKKGHIKPTEDKLTVADLMASVLTQKALSGDLKAIDMYMDRTEGKPVQKTENKNENYNREVTIDVEEDEG